MTLKIQYSHRGQWPCHPLFGRRLLRSLTGHINLSLLQFKRARLLLNHFHFGRVSSSSIHPVSVVLFWLQDLQRLNKRNPFESACSSAECSAWFSAECSAGMALSALSLVFHLPATLLERGSRTQFVEKAAERQI